MYVPCSCTEMKRCRVPIPCVVYVGPVADKYSKLCTSKILYFKNEHILSSTYTIFSRLSNAQARCKALFLEWVFPLSFRLTFNFLKSRRNYEGLRWRHANDDDDTTVSRHRVRMRFLFAQVSWFCPHNCSNFDPPPGPLLYGQKSEKLACEDLTCLNLLNSSRSLTLWWNASMALHHVMFRVDCFWVIDSFGSCWWDMTVKWDTWIICIRLSPPMT